ncbi:hypothetical protein T07_11864 [Trichinella nelsoni]|uniref:F-box domain-containing protein n=3 Tax=Trichinella TaxID=6333 RepID=A0A0V0SNW7_9BILA|nr:conserved hypothetical protein [Trichinella spiralis]KRX28151.1 hypothetical protein T07_11864 [Trichinella nelsoni]
MALGCSSPRNSTISKGPMYDSSVLNAIFAHLNYADIYFCRDVCPEWEKAVDEYFMNLDRLSVLKMTHFVIPEQPPAAFRICASCLHIAFTLAPHATEWDLRLYPFSKFIVDDEMSSYLLEIFRQISNTNSIKTIYVDQASKFMGEALKKYFPITEIVMSESC